MAIAPSRNAVLGDVHWRPDRDVVVALTAYALVVLGLFTAFQLFTTERVAANFIAFGPITLLGFGVALPVLYTVLARQRPLADLGITSRMLLPSLVLGLLLGFDTYYNTVRTLGVVWSVAITPLILMTLTVGLFEAVFFRGWLQLRFEAAFGIVPGLVLAALLYSLYHVGYGMSINEIVPLFGYGLVFGAVFRLTRNIFVLWPFYTPVGSLYANVREGLALPLEASFGFVLTLLAMAVVIYLGAQLVRRHAVAPVEEEAGRREGAGRRRLSSIPEKTFGNEIP